MTASLTVADGIGTLTLRRPDRLNTFDLETARAFDAMVDTALRDESVSCLLLRGEGRTFCGGGDVAAMTAASNASSYITELADTVHGALKKLHTGHLPVVTAVQGAAAGAGLALALSADVVVASESAVFRTAYAGIGLSPDCGLSWMLPRRIGEGRALELLLLDRKFTATEARTLGIVTTVCLDEAIVTVALEMASLLARAPGAQDTRSLVRAGWERTYDQQLDDEMVRIGKAVTRPEAARLMARFSR